jgi:hypothetical protein
MYLLKCDRDAMPALTHAAKPVGGFGAVGMSVFGNLLPLYFPRPIAGGTVEVRAASPRFFSVKDAAPAVGHAPPVRDRADAALPQRPAIG